MLPWISSLWHSQHWAEITLCHHTRTYHHNALFLLNSPIPLVSFSSELNILEKDINPLKIRKPLENPYLSCSSEPHLIANLRCYFADFPYLLSSTTPKALNLGDLLRSLVRSIMNSQEIKLHPASLCFSRFNRVHIIPLPESRKWHFSTYTLFSDWLISKVMCSDTPFGGISFKHISISSPESNKTKTYLTPTPRRYPKLASHNKDITTREQ